VLGGEEGEDMKYRERIIVGGLMVNKEERVVVGVRDG
jgi:hypothetical protein